MSAASYLENEQPAGQFYVKFNDADWAYEMAMIFIADKDAQTLPAGTYTLKEGTAPGSLSTASSINCYNPNSDCKLLAGSSITVTESATAGQYDIVMNLTLSDGRIAEFTYSGAISGTPKFKFDGETLDTLTASPYSGGNT